MLGGSGIKDEDKAEPPSIPMVADYTIGGINLIGLPPKTIQIVPGESLHDKELREEQERIALQKAEEERKRSRDVIPRESRVGGDALNLLWGKESAWEPGRLNKSSLACGIPQAYPCTKIYPHATREWILANKVVITDQRGNTKWYLPNPDKDLEIQWGLDYIKRRYGTASEALEYHFQNNSY